MSKTLGNLLSVGEVPTILLFVLIIIGASCIFNMLKESPFGENEASKQVLEKGEGLLNLLKNGYLWVLFLSGIIVSIIAIKKFSSPQQ